MEYRIPSGMSAPAIARATVSAATPGLDAETVYVLQLLTSELVTDAVGHGDDPFADDVILRLDCEDDDRVYVEVVSSDDRFDPLVRRRPSSTNGHGLFLVDQLVTRWGTDTDGSRTKVWFELPVADVSSSRAI